MFSATCAGFTPVNLDAGPKIGCESIQYACSYSSVDSVAKPVLGSNPISPGMCGSKLL
ncbi:MAG: hypothetical protein QXZ06_02535 [Candidatus Jordarchaeales archaeon]